MFSQSTRRICCASRASHSTPFGAIFCTYVVLCDMIPNMYFICSRAAPTLSNVAGDVRDEGGRNKRRPAWARARSGTGTGETPGHKILMRPRSGSPGLAAHAANAGAHMPSAARRPLPDLVVCPPCPTRLPPCYRLPASHWHGLKRYRA